jgi:hypothetical protein
LNTQEFLRYILPSSGYKFIANYEIKSDGTEYLKHTAFDSFEDAAAYVEKADKKESTVYYACASFKESHVYETVKGVKKKRWRVGANALAVKAFWVDIDVGKKDKHGNPKGHQTHEAARDALRNFVQVYSLPEPLIVSSGGGYHVYWSLTKPIPADVWKRLARIFSQMASRVGLEHDAECTFDVVRILRPVGSHHRKTAVAKPVEIVGEVPEQIDTVVFAKMLVDWAKENRYTPEAETSAAPIANDLAYTPDYPPSSAFEIIKSCKQLADIAATKGDVEEPLWYTMIGLVKHTVEGEDLCHEWSSGHEQYDPDATDRKIIQWVQGPSTCKKFENLNPAGCEGCQFKGKVKSPIQLGQVLPKQAEISQKSDMVDEDEELPQGKELFGKEADSIEFPEDVAEKFSWDGSSLYCKYFDSKQKTPRVAAFSDILFLPVNYFRDPRTGHYRVIWAIYERNSRKREFELTGAAMGVGGMTLFKELGEQGVVALDGQKKHMEAYVSTWFNSLRKRTDEINVFHQFGWQKDWSFVLGNTQYLPDGTTRRIRTTGNAATPLYQEAFEPKGTLQQQIDLIDRVYNYLGQEQYQFTFGVGFGAPLIRLLENYGGVIINGYSPEKGLGKSTAGKLALGIYGDPKVLVRTKQQTTSKAFNAHCGVLNSLPVMLDEATNVEPKMLSEIAYTFSQGTPSQGLNPDGSMRTTLHNWSTVMICNANRSLIGTVGAGKAYADAEMGRILEYQFVKTSSLCKEEADEVLHEAEKIYGHMGQVYVQYLVQNREKVVQFLMQVQKRIDKRINATVADRFHSIGVASSIAGLMIAKQLGLIKFDMVALTDWIVAKVRKLHTQIQENLPPPTDIIGNMLSELNNGFIVTNVEGDARNSTKVAIVTNHPKGQTITGRLIQDDGILYVQQKVINQWCAKNQADYNELWITAVSSGWAHPEVVNYALGKGTKEYGMSPVRCWKLDVSKMAGEAAIEKISEKIYAIK